MVACVEACMTLLIAAAVVLTIVAVVLTVALLSD